jgi:hypothetical protein
MAKKFFFDKNSKETIVRKTGRISYTRKSATAAE